MNTELVHLGAELSQHIVIDALNHSDQRLMDRADADKTENIALKGLDAVGTEIPAV